MSYVLIDSSNIICKYYFGIPFRTTYTGIPINAVEGWLGTIITIRKDFPEYQIICGFDSENLTKSSTVDNYKAGRKQKEQAMILQFKMIRRLSEYLGIPCVSKEREEADDVLSSLCHYLKGNKLILSEDKDMAQCVQDDTLIMRKTRQSLNNNWLIEGKHDIKKRFGVYPEQIVDYLVLVGDAADNIKGATGVGPKTASKLLSEYSTIENIYLHIKSLPPQVAKSLENYRQQMPINKSLIKLKTNLIQDNPLATPNKDLEAAKGLLRALTLESCFNQFTNL